MYAHLLGRQCQRDCCIPDNSLASLQVCREDLRKLLVHSLPPHTPIDAVRDLFQAKTLVPLEVEPLPDNHRAMLVTFSHPGDANTAFRLLQVLPGVNLEAMLYWVLLSFL